MADQDMKAARAVLDHIPAGCVLPSCDAVLTQAIAAAIKSARAEERERGVKKVINTEIGGCSRTALISRIIAAIRNPTGGG